MLLAALAVALLGSATTEAPPSDVYLKRDGEKWVRVRRGPAGMEILGPAEAPSGGDPRAGAGTLFQPWSATVTGSWPEAVAIGDVTGDGRSDVVLTTSYYVDPANDYMLFVFAQQPDGTLGAPVRYPTLGTYIQRPATVAVGDVNGDGRNDVVIGNQGMGLGVFRQNGAGTLDAVDLRPSANSGKVRVADVNTDGRLDVVGLGGGVSVLLQDALGQLGPPVAYPLPNAGADLEVGDVNGDGRGDVVVMCFQPPNLAVLYQRPDGTLGDLASHSLGAVTSQGAAVGDVTGDGRSDVVLSYGGNSPNARLAVFRQLPAGPLAPPSSLVTYDVPEPVEAGDADGDGRSDVVVAHGGWLALGVHLQNAAGTLDAEDRYAIPYASHYNPHGIAVGDINGDDAPDVVIADYNHGLVVLRHVPWSVTVTAPNTAVSWVIGTTRTISWASSLPRYAVVDIALSRDGGASYTDIATGIPDSGSFPWTVTGPPTLSARIRVTWRTALSDRPLRADASDVNFTISTTVRTARPSGR